MAIESMTRPLALRNEHSRGVSWARHKNDAKMIVRYAMGGSKVAMLVRYHVHLETGLTVLRKTCKKTRSGFWA